MLTTEKVLWIGLDVETVIKPFKKSVINVYGVDRKYLKIALREAVLEWIEKHDGKVE